MEATFLGFTANQWAAGGQVISALFAVWALLVSLLTFKKTRAMAHLSALDEMYLEILKIGIDHPEFRIPERRDAITDKAQYDIYAHMVWCFVETICDRAKSDPRVLETWAYAIDAEDRLHRGWIAEERNHHLFKLSFLKYVSNYTPPPLNSCVITRCR
jgi:hypothetical protein